MADEEEKTESEEKPKSSKKKLIIFIVLAIVLIGVSVGGTLMAIKFLSPETEPEVVQELDEDGNPIEEVVEEEVVEEEIKGPAIYFPLRPALIVNYDVRGRQRFLKAEISIMTRDEEVITAAEIHMPMIRNNLILLFSGQTYDELQTDEGRELLKQDSLTELQKIMEQEIGKPGVEKLLFTNFVMQ
jgi:flagellar FliL protein